MISDFGIRCETSALSVCSSGDSPTTRTDLGDRADFQGDVDAGNVADGDRHVVPRDVAESGQRDLDVVRSRLNVDDAVGAIRSS